MKVVKAILKKGEWLLDALKRIGIHRVYVADLHMHSIGLSVKKYYIKFKKEKKS